MNRPTRQLKNDHTLEDMVSLENVVTAMCLWEAIQDMVRGDIAKGHTEANMFISEEGAWTAREAIALLAPKVDKAWMHLSDELRDNCDSFDWEVVPDLILELMRAQPHTWPDADQELVTSCMKGVACRHTLENSQ